MTKHPKNISMSITSIESDEPAPIHSPKYEEGDWNNCDYSYWSLAFPRYLIPVGIHRFLSKLTVPTADKFCIPWKGIAVHTRCCSADKFCIPWRQESRSTRVRPITSHHSDLLQSQVYSVLPPQPQSRECTPLRVGTGKNDPFTTNALSSPKSEDKYGTTPSGVRKSKGCFDINMKYPSDLYISGQSCTCIMCLVNYIVVSYDTAPPSSSPLRLRFTERMPPCIPHYCAASQKEKKVLTSQPTTRNMCNKTKASNLPADNPRQNAIIAWTASLSILRLLVVSLCVPGASPARQYVIIASTAWLSFLWLVTPCSRCGPSASRSSCCTCNPSSTPARRSPWGRESRTRRAREGSLRPRSA